MRHLLTDVRQTLEITNQVISKLPEEAWAEDIRMLIKELDTVSLHAWDMSDPIDFLREKSFDALIESLNNITSRYLKILDFQISASILGVIITGDRVVERMRGL